MKPKVIRRLEKGLGSKKPVKTSTADDRSFFWKFSLITPLPVLLLLPVDTTGIFAVILLGIGGGMTVLSLYRIRQFRLSARWQTTTGTLLYKKVAIDNPAAADRGRSYFPYIKYRYAVGSREYYSDSVGNYRELRDFPEEIEEWMEQLATPSLRVYYNPEKPSQSLLIADMPLHRRLFWIFIFVLGCSSVAVGVISVVPAA